MRLRTAADVGATIRARRRALGLDQRELAKRVGVSRAWVIEIEKGKPRAALRLVLRSLEVLGVSLNAEEGEAPPSEAGLPRAAVDLDSILRAHRRSSGPRR